VSRSAGRHLPGGTGNVLLSVVLALLAACGFASPARAADGTAPGAPGASANWTTGNKQGLGTAVGRDSKVWYTLAGGALSEVYYPSGDTANVRSLEFAVTDGSTFVDRESEDTTQTVRLDDRRSLTYSQVDTAKSGRYRITKTYITDPDRATVLVRVQFEPLLPGSYRLFALYDPAIGNSSRGDSASRRGSGSDVALLAADGPVASALVSSSGFARTSSGFVGTSDGWTDLDADHRLARAEAYRAGWHDGGAGEWDGSLASKDTDTRDPNTLDVMVGAGQSQSQVLDWRTASPVQLPMLPLAG
jgi:glucoamylase